MIRKPTTRSDYVIEQPLSRYTEEDHAIWRALFHRQEALLPGRACDEYLQGLHGLEVAAEGGIPDFRRLSDILGKATGWSIVAVPGLVPDVVFFEHLANRRFPVTWWIRRPEQMDYLQEPDVFHDLFGHVPLLMNPIFGDYMEAYGKGGLKADRMGEITHLARLYWYTVEFGLIRDRAAPSGLRIYGSGILSSKSESIYCLDSPGPNRVEFDLLRVMRTKYRIDTFQKTYFVIDSFEQLFTATLPDFTPIYAQLRGTSDYGAGDLAPDDRIITRGNREGWGETEDV